MLYQLEQDVQGEKGLLLYKYPFASTHQGENNDSVPALRLSIIWKVSFASKILWLEIF